MKIMNTMNNANVKASIIITPTSISWYYFLWKYNQTVKQSITIDSKMCKKDATQTKI